MNNIYVYMNGGQNYLFIFKTAQIGVVPYRL